MENIDEINKLKEELEIRDKMVEHFRQEALNWARIANEYQKDKTKLEQTLQEIKKIAEEHINTRMLLSDRKSFLEFNNISNLITKAEEK